MSWFSRFVGRNDAEREKPSGGESPTEEDALIRELISSVDISAYNADPSESSAFQKLMAMDRQQQADHLGRLVAWLVEADRNVRVFQAKHGYPYNSHQERGWSSVWGTRRILYAVMTRLMAKKLPLSDETLSLMLDWCLESGDRYNITNFYPLVQLVGVMESRMSSGGAPEVLIHKLAKMGDMLEGQQKDNQVRKVRERIHALLGIAPEIPISVGEVWADAAITDLSGIDASQRAAWVQLLMLCKSATGGAPSVKWLKQATLLLDKIDPVCFRSFTSRWFVLTDEKRTRSALSNHQWNLRCAEEAFGKQRYEFLQLLPAKLRKWDSLDIIDEALRSADDPWAYLRGFPEKPEARKLFGEHPPTIDLPASPPAFAPVEDILIIPAHMELLVGLVWVAGLVKDTAVTRSLGVMAVSMYRKVPGKGPRAVRVGNACITALGMIGDEDALGQLALLKVKVKFGGAQAALIKAMTKLADKLGVSREDLEEMSVPAYGMTEVGRLTQEFGESIAVLTIVDSRSTAVSWTRKSGKPQKSVPAEVKQDFAEDLKEFSAAKKDIERMLPAQAERLDGLYLQRKSWPFHIWRERYLDHPLTGALARRLLWNFTEAEKTITGIWLNDRIMDRGGNPISLDESKTVVSLWHPLQQDVRTVLSWRDFLEEWQIVQPFKQAHREVYLLTPAEERTQVYSNRFAAHLLRQHQFNALCAARGWKNTLRLMVDAEYPPATRWLPEWGLRAEYWIEGAGTEYGEDTLDSGAYRYVATDQVRFYQIDSGQVSAHAGGGGYNIGGRNQVPPEPLPLEQIDSLVFSEVMRDVDLFVGVGSVGNDPNWLDGGRNEHRRDYWQSVSFGELNASARTRKEILEKLVPKLKIAEVCTLEDRFLIVRGKRHGYKIHLGSGNILIMPQDKYLCIVPAQGQIEKAGERLFLPFEGDRTLSVILSKAFLLAQDDKITDATILRQLG
jgi:hypothetical protein